VNDDRTTAMKDRRVQPFTKRNRAGRLVEGWSWLDLAGCAGS
jgi:hypothetical protein